jgi:hypothetical protein
MRLHQIQNKYLYEGLDHSASSTMLLWENAGVQLREAALTADQIQQIFAAVEKSATDSGSNRTMLGKGKDAASAVNKAWEDLKTKIQDSGPIKNFDQKVSDVLSKIGMGADDPQFDGQVNKWVQKYRDFAKKHPIAQGAIYATLIALAGITGAGVGGAVALGLLKMSDQLLQGKRFSSAAYSGVKAGAMAFAASKLGDLIKGMKPGDQIPKVIDGQDIVDVPGVPKMDFQKYDYYLGDSGNVVAVTKGAPNPFTGELGSAAASSAGNAASTGSDLSNQILDQSLSNPAGRSAARQAVAAALDSGDITAAQGKELIKQIGSAAANPEAAEQAISQTLQNVGSGAAKSAAKSAGTSIADIAASTDIPATGNDSASNIAKNMMSDPELAAKMSKSAVDSIPNINDQAAKAAWAAVQKQVESGELTDHKRLSFALNRALNQAFNDFGTNPYGPSAEFSKRAAREILAKAKDTETLLAALQGGKAESQQIQGKKLSEGQVYLVFNRICQTNNQMIAEGKLAEGPLDALKGFAAKGLAKAKTVGKNLTTKVTADKLNSAWQAAGSPMDSTEVAQLLADQGVDSGVVDKVFKDLKISAAAPAAKSASGVSYAEVKKLVMTLPKKEKQRMIQYITKQLGTA